VLVGSLGLFRPGPTVAVVVATMYAGFAGFLGYTILAGVSLGSCGCLGDRELAPNRLHLLLNLVAAGSAVGAALMPFPGVVSFAASLPYRGVPFLAGLTVAGYLAYATVAELPQAMFAYRSDPSSETLSRPGRPAAFLVRGPSGP
jgi:hypothetical protein